jgi:hypothetical protein
MIDGLEDTWNESHPRNGLESLTFV